MDGRQMKQCWIQYIKNRLGEVSSKFGDKSVEEYASTMCSILQRFGLEMKILVW